MAIKPPAWCSHAVPVKNKGWVDPKSGELYKSSRFTQAEIDEFHGTAAPAPAPIPEPEPIAIDEEIHDLITEGKIEAVMLAQESEESEEEEDTFDK